MLWVKAFHLIFVITWFSAIFYLPRLFVYHAMCEDEAGNERFKVMERKLYRGIMTPSAIATVLLGGWLLSFYSIEAIAAMHWLHLKLVLVVFVLGYHHYCGRVIQQFKNNANKRSHKFYRLFNELPVLLMIPIVILAIVKPF